MRAALVRVRVDAMVKPPLLPNSLAAYDRNEGIGMFTRLIFAVKRYFLVRDLEKGALSWLFKNIDFVINGLVEDGSRDLRLLRDSRWEIGLNLSGAISLSKEPHKVGGGKPQDDPTIWALPLNKIAALNGFWGADNGDPIPEASIKYLASCISVMIFNGVVEEVPADLIRALNRLHE